MLSLRLLQSLPYHLQEDIVALLPTSSLHALTLTCKYFSALSARSLHACLHFLPGPAGAQSRLDPEIGQWSYIRSLQSHPEYARFTRHLDWCINSQSKSEVATVWACFAELTAVTHLNLRLELDDDSEAPKSDLFPNLRCAKLSGLYPAGTLDCILHGEFITHLEFDGLVAEFHGTPAWTTRLSPFLIRAIESRLFQRLKHLKMKVVDRYYEHVAACALELWLLYLSHNLEELQLELKAPSAVDVWCLFSLDRVFLAEKQVDNRWDQLARLTIKGAALSPQVTAQVKRSCSNLVNLQIVKEL